MPRTLKVKVNDKWYTVEVGELDSNPVRVLVDGEPVDVDTEQMQAADGANSAEVIEEAQAEPQQQRQIGTPAPVKVFHSPMPGVIISVAVREGDQVVTGDEICKLEAMKMQQSLRADWSGIVKRIHVSAGQQVREGDLIAELE